MVGADGGRAGGRGGRAGGADLWSSLVNSVFSLKIDRKSVIEFLDSAEKVASLALDLLDMKRDHDATKVPMNVPTSVPERRKFSPCESFYAFYKGMCGPLDGTPAKYCNYARKNLISDCNAVWDGRSLHVPYEHRALREQMENDVASWGYKSVEEYMEKHNYHYTANRVWKKTKKKKRSKRSKSVEYMDGQGGEKKKKCPTH